MLGGINALHAAFPVDADEEYQTQGNLKIVFKEDLGWFSVFMSIGFSFYQPQIGSQTYHQFQLLGCSLLHGRTSVETSAFDDMFVSQFVVGRKENPKDSQLHLRALHAFICYGTGYWTKKI